MSVRANFAHICLQGMRDRSMRGGKEFAREIQLTDWSTAGEQGKLVFVVSTTPSLAQFISLFTAGKSRHWIVQITYQFKFFSLLDFCQEKKRRKEIRFEKQNFFSYLQFNSSLVRCKKTCLTGFLEYKYRVIFVLVLGVICTLRSAVG